MLEQHQQLYVLCRFGGWKYIRLLHSVSHLLIRFVKVGVDDVFEEKFFESLINFISLVLITDAGKSMSITTILTRKSRQMSERDD